MKRLVASFVMLLMISTQSVACQKRIIPVPPEKAINPVHENGCVCENLNKPTNEYDFVGIATVADINDILDFCNANDFISDGAAAYVEAALDDDSVESTSSCKCPDIPDPTLDLMVLIEREYLDALGAAILECRDRAIDAQEPESE